MNSLTKRLDALEQAGSKRKTKKAVLWVDFATDGGLVHEGQFYASCSALLHVLEYEQGDTVQIVGWQATQTAAELLTEVKKAAAYARIQETPSNIAPESQELLPPGHYPSGNHGQPFTTPGVSTVLPEIEHRQEYAVRPQYSVTRPSFWGEYFDIEPSENNYAIGGLPSLFDF